MRRDAPQQGNGFTFGHTADNQRRIAIMRNKRVDIHA
ncbi:Uncharacterised protein [Salmonella enterica subsp. enterica serovar Bovismorbificans]|uniref:Uncharacterized protein n=1 Tax=Salmonella enterica subsp. enterica serovar Bovismorbificans TaxID=58097 RepID=A0A655C4M8_SALET|nr:Uncharacterised protein [Salmonella enterica subsp. enterica serovar Bovismorbificans]CNU38717.1 Uncharacterised protein [Salmonella enterica subsp. enterica serovar Bovismorbificans]